MEKIIIFVIMLTVVYISVSTIPGGVEKFALDPDKISEGWRFFTYPFAHLNIRHLVENIIGLGLISFIAIELKTGFGDFSSTYLSSGFLSVIPVWMVLSFTTLGASNAIFGGFGLVSQEIKKYKMKGWIIILVLSLLIFMKSILSAGSEQFYFAFKQDLAHFSGLLFGIGFFYLLKAAKPLIMKKKRYVLRGDYR